MKTCAQCQIKYPDALDFCPQDGTALPAAQGRPQTQALYDALIGSTIDGRYRIETKLGEGGMGLVYAARHVLIDKRVAMKVLKLDAQSDPSAGQRFIQEAKSASKIGHANIVDITDFGQLPDGSAYFVMEFIEGQTLGAVIRRGPMPAGRVLHVVSQMARGLHAAHGKGIIHRDLKPENIFLTDRDGQSDIVKIVDFGIAKVQEAGALGGAAGQKLTQVGMVLGTPEYMSPEQATGKETDHRVDEYALGCMMYEMLTGDVPFRADSSTGTLTRHVFEAVVPPRKRRPDLAIPQPVEDIVLRAMQKRPEDRYPSMKELVGAVEAVAADLDSGKEAQRTAERRSSQMRPTVASKELSAEELASVGQGGRRSGRVGLYAAVGIAVVGLGGAAAWKASRASGARRADPTETVASLGPAAVSDDSAARAAALAAGSPVTMVTRTAGSTRAPATPATVEVTLRTIPAGAEIVRDGMTLGTTPKTLTLTPGKEAIAFLLRKGGYQELRRDIVPDGNQDVDVMLVPRAAASGGGTSAARGRSTPRLPSSSAGTAGTAAEPRNSPGGRPAAARPERRSPSDLRDPFAQ